MHQQKNTGKQLSNQGAPMRICYRSQLERELKLCKQEIKKQEALVYQNKKTSDADFMDEYDKLNLLRIKEQTIESRIANLNYWPGGIEKPEIVLIQTQNHKHHE